MKGRAITYSDAELIWVKDNSTRPRREAHAEFVDVWDRPDVSFKNFCALCKRNGWLTGRTGQFPKGNVSHNKGKKGWHTPGSEKGWFKKGSRSGRAAELYQPIGAERITQDGYIERKIHDGMPMQSRWRLLHLVRWEEINGPIPEGMALKCLDGNRQNTDPSNWECIPRGMLPRLNGKCHRNYDTAPAELKPTIMATAKLEHAIAARRKDT